MDIIRKLSYIFTTKQKRQIIRLFVLIVIGSGLELLGVSAILPVIQGIMNPGQIRENEVLNYFFVLMQFSSEQSFIVALLLSMVIIFLVKNIYLVFLYRSVYKFTFNNRRILSIRMLQCYMQQPYPFHVENNSADLLRNINCDADNFYGVVMASLKLMVEVIVCCVLGVYLFIKDKTICISIICLMSLMLLFFFKVYKKIVYQVGKSARESSGDMNKWIQQSFGGIKEIKILNKERFFSMQYEKYSDINARSGYLYHTITYIPKPVIEVMCITGLLGAIAIKYLRGATISYFVPIISVFAVAAFRLLPSFNRITEYLGEITYKKPSIEAVYNDLLEIDLLNNEKLQKDVSIPPISFRKDLVIHSVDFNYPNTNTDVLRGVSLRISKNESVAFIGPSGAGKTTLADIILGLLTPTNGEVLVDDNNIEANIDGWHNLLGYIPQNIYLMDDSIRNNIAFGVAEINEERLEKVVEQAQLRELINSLEDGLDTKIGEMGIRLSGGQRQRIGIARALYNNPQILILDEATSALDNDTELAVMSAIESLHGRVTLIIIAHRLSTIESCDSVYEVKDGCVRKVR